MQRRWRMRELQDLDSAEIWSENVRCSSKMKPRLRAEWVVFREELRILASCCLSPMRRNSILEELRVGRLPNRNTNGPRTGKSHATSIYTRTTTTNVNRFWPPLAMPVEPIATNATAAWSVCLSVILVHRAKAVKRNETSFDRDTCVASTDIILDGNSGHSRVVERLEGLELKSESALQVIAPLLNWTLDHLLNTTPLFGHLVLWRIFRL